MPEGQLSEILVKRDNESLFGFCLFEYPAIGNSGAVRSCPSHIVAVSP